MFSIKADPVHHKIGMYLYYVSSRYTVPVPPCTTHIVRQVADQLGVTGILFSLGHCELQGLKVFVVHLCARGERVGGGGRGGREGEGGRVEHWTLYEYFINIKIVII